MQVVDLSRDRRNKRSVDKKEIEKERQRQWKGPRNGREKVGVKRGGALLKRVNKQEQQ